jgi:hypothetical protein
MDKFEEMEEIRDWEPKVSRIDEWMLIKHRQKQVSAQEFTVEILCKFFYRGYGKIILKKGSLIWKELIQKMKQRKLVMKYTDGGRFGIRIKMDQFMKQ